MIDNPTPDALRDGASERPARQVVLATCLCFLVPLLLYLPTLRYGFVYDDLPLVLRNDAIRSLSTAMGYFQHDFDAYTRGWEGVQSNYYRPLTFLFMALVHPWSDDDPARWHAIVIVLNATVGALAFHVLRAHRLSLMRAVFAALLFSLHPLHVHSAAWITGLHDVLAGVFVLSGYWALARWLDVSGSPDAPPPTHSAPVVFAVCLILGLLSKESSLALAALSVLLAALTAWRRPGLRRRAAAAATVTVAISAAYLVLRAEVLGGFARPFPTAPDWPQALASIAPLCWAYLRTWMVPIDLSLFSSFRPVVQGGSSLLLAWSGALLMAGAALVLGWRRRAWAYPLLFGACLLAPYLNLRVLNPEWALMHRYFYLPGLALAWMIALLPVPARLQRPGQVMGAAMLILLAIGSLHDMRAYRDESAFWAKAVEKDPTSSAAWTEQGRLLLERGDVMSARKALQRALELNPDYLLPWLRLGNLAFSQRDFAVAAEHFRAATVRGPDYPPAWRNLPTALLAAGQRRAAFDAADEAMRRFPTDGEILAAVGTVRKLGGDLPGALQAFRALVRVRPRDAIAWLRLASLQAEAGATDEAQQSLSHVAGLTLDPAVRTAAEQLGRSLQTPQ